MAKRVRNPWSFGTILLFWICASIVLSMIVALLIRSGVLERDPGLYRLVQLGPGVHLLARPAAPANLAWRWGEDKSRRFIRGLAGAYLLLLAAVWLF